MISHPFIILRYCQVSGKCFTCHAIYERLEVFGSERDLEAIRYLCGVHKLFIEKQRLAYMMRRQRAQEHPELFMSVIIDGMSQDHCILPYYAGKAQSSKTVLKQKISGAKQHGFFKTFYRTTPITDTGSNLACEVLMLEIEQRMDYCIANDLAFPKHLSIQIDGGPENTSKVFYALCEHLVRIGVFDQIEVSRLPVGHTHEDIDALFGVIWRACQQKTIISPQAWETIVLSAFEQEYADKSFTRETMDSR